MRLAIIALTALLAPACSKDTAKTDTPAPADAAAARPRPPDAAAPLPVDAAAPAVVDAAAPAGDEASDNGAKLDESAAPKNIKLLPRSWKLGKIQKHMKAYNKALGVKCDFCHDLKDYASDANKHKNMARSMMRMTRAMNKKFFKGKPAISCVTCHRGHEHPEED